MGRSTSREAIRLWYEYLRRAQVDPMIQVHNKYYEAWGDVTKQSFKPWWLAIGAKLFERPRVQVVEGTPRRAPKTTLVEVPQSLTPTAAGNALRVVLMDHYQKSGYQPKPAFDYQLTEGKEIKVASLRAYLHTYDAYQRLLLAHATVTKPIADAVNRSYVRKGRSKLEVSGKELLTEVRRVYLVRTEHWKSRNGKVEPLPTALSQGMTINPATEKAVEYAGVESSALQAVSRYLRIANRLVRNAAQGSFPGNYS